jgi:hypothetical protein
LLDGKKEGALPPPVAAVDPNEARFAKIQARLDRERKDNVERQLDQLVIDNKISAEEAKEFALVCIADETDKILATLKKREPVLPGVEPMAFSGSGGIDIIEKVRGMKAGATRREFLKENYAAYRHNLHKTVPRGPQAANTVDALLVPQFLADGLVVVMQNKLANWTMFSRKIEIDPIKPKAVIQVKKAVSGATGQQNPTDFEATPDSNLDNIPITPNQESLTFQVSNEDRLNGITLADLAEINALTFANQLNDRFTAVMLVATYGAALNIGSAANFDPDDLSPILAVAKNYRKKQLILDGGHLAYITPKLTTNVDYRTNGAFGFDSIGENNRWTGATANTVGFVTGPDAIGWAAGPSVELPAQYYESLISTLLINGMSVQTAIWFTTKARQMFCCHDIMLGVGPGDATQAELLVTA